MTLLHTNRKINVLISLLLTLTLLARPPAAQADPGFTLEDVQTWQWGTWGTAIHSVAVGNVDGDDPEEIVTGGTYQPGEEGNIAQLTVWEGGTLQGVETWSWGEEHTFISAVAAGDVDSDGSAEIVTCGHYDEGTRWVAQLCVWSNSQNLEGVQTWYWTDDTWVKSVAVADVDGDGQLEIITGGFYFDGSREWAQLCVWDGATLGLKRVRTWYWTGMTLIRSVAVRDVDGDGHVEIVTGGDYDDGTRAVAQLCVWDGATLALENVKTWYWTDDTHIYSVAVRDVDGDGHVEIVTGGYYHDGTRLATQLCVWDGATLALEDVVVWHWIRDTYLFSVAVADVDGDGDVEIVTGGQYYDGTGNWAQVCVWGFTCMHAGFSIRIADFMPVRVTYPDMDDPIAAGYFQSALDDLADASNGEITHVQLRLYWTIDRTSNEAMSHPYLGSSDSWQQELMDNWRSWYFGNPTPATGKSAIQRIREAGFRLEIGLSVSWLPGQAVDIPPPFARYAREADWEGFDGSVFVQEYFHNCLKPVAEEARDSGLLEAGDIFFLGFENYYPECDHPRLHSTEYISVIGQLRTILPPGVLISDHISGWYDDRGLGHNYSEGFLNIAYLAALDIVAPSMWIPWLRTADLPATPENIRDAHFRNMRFDKLGTGYNGIPAELGRDFMNDAQLIYLKWNTPLMWNSGVRNVYGVTTWDVPEQGGTPSPEGEAEQAAFWAGRLMALSNQTWAVGQDFERYCEPATYSGYTASWRGRPAEAAIIDGIRAILP